MTGKYDIEIYNKRVHYHLTVKRNITVIQGDSATGKTELLRMISDYENNGISSGITKICEKRCVVIENASWKERLATLQQCIIFIDEGAPFLRNKEFTRMVKGSDNNSPNWVWAKIFKTMPTMMVNTVLAAMQMKAVMNLAST